MSSRHIRGRQVHSNVLLVSSGASAAFTNESLAIVNKSSGSATALTLTANPVHGTRCKVIDGKGDALANNITVAPASGTINGLANHIIPRNWGEADYVYDGRSETPEWKVASGFLTNSLLWRNCPYRLEPDPSVWKVWEDDFLNPASATASDYHAYTSNDDAGTGTNAFQDAAGGVYNVVTAAADNDYHAMSLVAENWKFAAGKKLWFEARFKLAEATTNESAWWFGLTDTLTTGGFQANAAGPLASYDGAMIWKDEATMAIDFETSNAGTQATTTNMATFVTDTWTRVGLFFDGTATTSVVTPYYDVGGGLLIAGTPQNITLSGLEEMHLVFGVKAGPTAAAETLQVDKITCVQLA
jgi:hypothetical protein